MEERLLQVAQVSSGTGAESQACSYICNSWETVRIGLAAAAATQTPQIGKENLLYSSNAASTTAPEAPEASLKGDKRASACWGPVAADSTGCQQNMLLHRSFSWKRLTNQSGYCPVLERWIFSANTHTHTARCQRKRTTQSFRFYSVHLCRRL